jgi:hypothetical protein
MKYDTMPRRQEAIRATAAVRRFRHSVCAQTSESAWGGSKGPNGEGRERTPVDEEASASGEGANQVRRATGGGV